jgi:predicted nucleic acid-binding protein
MIIVSDTSPLNYLVLIGYVDVLAKLFGRIIIPRAVFREMQHPKTPPEVKTWMNAAPAWLEVRQADFSWFTPSKKLGDGEHEAIALAKRTNAAILIDDRDGTREAHKNSLTTVSTLTLLDKIRGYLMMKSSSTERREKLRNEFV